MNTQHVHVSDHRSTDVLRHVLESPTTGLAAIWLSAGLVSVFAPDMVTGSQHEHLPIAALTVWVWAAVATGYLLMGTREGRSSSPLVAGTSLVWLAVLVATVFAPVLVTGTDPTRVPIAVFVAPVAGAIATGFLALHHLR